MTEEIEHPHVALKRELEKRTKRLVPDRENELRLLALGSVINLVKLLEIYDPNLCYMTALEIIQDVANYRGLK